MRTSCITIVVATTAALIAACAPGPESARGFRLPDGDPAAGEQAFIDFQCHACHKLVDTELPPINIEAPVSVTLGGPVSRVRTYGQLVTSIINPSHRLIRNYPKEEVSVDGRSFMPTLNDYMTVRQLIDIVAFLQGEYDVVLPTRYPYSVYQYGPAGTAGI